MNRHIALAIRILLFTYFMLMK